MNSSINPISLFNLKTYMTSPTVTQELSTVQAGTTASREQTQELSQSTSSASSGVSPAGCISRSLCSPVSFSQGIEQQCVGGTVLGFLRDLNKNSPSQRQSPIESRETESPKSQAVQPMSKEDKARNGLEEMVLQLDFWVKGTDTVSFEEYGIIRQELLDNKEFSEIAFSPFQAARIAALFALPIRKDDDDPKKIKKLLQVTLQILFEKKAFHLLSGKEIGEVIYYCDGLDILTRGMTGSLEEVLLQEKGKKISEIPASLLAELMRFFMRKSFDRRFFVAAEQELYRDKKVKLKEIAACASARVTLLLICMHLGQNGEALGNRLLESLEESMGSSNEPS